jgi:arylsulfatase A-like enzyme
MKKRNAVLVVTILAAGLLATVGSAGGARPKNLIIVLVDALRWDHLGVYGYGRDTSPNIDRFAAEGLVFHKAISQSGWTAPAVMALFSAGYPEASLENSRTFAQWLERKGFQTAAFTANPIMIEKMGYSRGFQTYDLAPWKNDAAMVERSLAWLEDRDPSRPFCLYVHLMDVHDPYKPTPPFDSKFGKGYTGRIGGEIKSFKERIAEGKAPGLSPSDLQRLRDLYDGGIASMDRQFAAFLRGLKDTGVYEDSIIVFMSDHGDEFLEHGGIAHGHSLYEELIHIPLIVKGPRIRKGRYDRLFAMVDLPATLMDLLGVPFDYEVAGISFRKALNRNRPLRDRAFSEVYGTIGLNGGCWVVSVRMDKQKLLYIPHEKKYALYDLSVNTIEGEPLPGGMTGSRRRVALSLHRWRQVHGMTKNVKEDDEEYLEALRSLGYIK